MPFQSEKQRRFLHANHPEIAKRWEKEYANGGISNHFRKKLSEGSEDSYGQLLDDWDAGLIIDALPGEDFTTYYNRIMKVENDTGTEEVESLNLLAENQDPLNLSEGVTTLFQAKDGGRIGFKRGTSGAPGGGDPGMTSGGGNKGRQDPMGGRTDQTAQEMREADPDQFGGGMNIGGDGNKGGDNYKDPILGMVKTPKQQHDDILDRNAHRFKSLKDLTLDQKTRWAKDKYEDFKTAKGFMSIAAGPFGWLSAGKAVLDANKRKKETITQLKTDIKTLTDLGYPTHHHTVDTLIQSLNQEILDMTQHKDQKDTKGDGVAPVPLPVVMDEMAEATDEGAIDMFDAWGEIKRKQALNASLQAKWAAEKEAKDQSFILANSGGLANLFRVKNQ